jgi:hypothetical protein
MVKQAEPIKFDRRLVGPQITVGGQVIQPLAQARGMYSVAGGQAAGGWAFVRVTPVAVQVRGADGSESQVALVDGRAEAIKAMVRPALLIAGVGLAIMALVRIIRH